MDSNSDEIARIRAASRYFSEWLARYQMSSMFAPRALEIRDQLDWHEKVLSECPPEASNLMGSGSGTPTSCDYGYVTTAFPMPTAFDENLVASATGYMASASNSVFGQLTTAGRYGTNAVQAYVTVHTESFQNFQQVHHRRDAVRALVGKLGGCSVDRFDKAVVAVEQARLQTGSDSAAASEIRTLLHGVKGELTDKARLLSKERKITWQTIAETLGKSEEDKKTLIKEGDTHKSLVDTLSPMLKDRSGTLPSLANVWTQVLEHLYAVLSLTM